MFAQDLSARLTARLVDAGVTAHTLLPQVLVYLELLARWNRTINLTAFNLDHPTDQAIDRLIVEPLAAVRYVRPDERLVVDIGSGGGSPALPIKIACPSLRMVLVEARVRKSAFLREAVRALSLTDTEVETSRFGPEGVSRLSGAADLVTMRAIRADAESFWGGIRAVTHPASRLFWFGGRQADGMLPTEWMTTGTPIVTRSFLEILART